MSMTEKIKIALIKRNMSVTELANILGSTPQNLSAKFRRDNFCEKDLQEIAIALNCRFEANFIDNITGETLT
jgi:DNA-binding Xre family transcriptional regulator